MRYIKPERLLLKAHPEFNERWVQNLIADDPSILGLGDLVLRDKERIQPRAGRLDLLLQDQESLRRYEVEIQLGATDEAHIIRTIEYWDIERKRYPQYEHCAVIIAEDITSRFLNVISLFNGSVPLIAIQLRAVKFEDAISLVFTTVLDEMTRGVVDEDEEAEAAPTTREDWTRRSSKPVLDLVDGVLGLVRSFDPNLQLKYNKFYIGLLRDGQPFNVILMRPRKSALNLTISLPKTEEIDALIDAAGFDALDYQARRGRYALSLSAEDLTTRREPLSRLIELAYRTRAE